MNSSKLLSAIATVCMLAAGCGDDTGDSGGFEYRSADACLGASDNALIEQHLQGDAGVPDGGLLHPNELVRDCVLGSCTSELFAGMGLDQCVGTCLETTSLAGLTPDCLGCFTDYVICGQEFCVAECIASSGVGCTDCLEAHCNPGQRDCTGMPNL